jgi:ABC-type nitrate/sulfonate/bicarbonate transport system substrate-binding protein
LPVHTPLTHGVRHMQVSRRRFLGTGGATLGLVAIAPSLLAACGSSESDGASGSAGDTADLGTLSFQLGWLNSLSYAPDYLWKARKYDIDEGFAGNDLLVGGPSVPAVPVVLSGKSRFGQSEPDAFASAVLEGAAVKIIGAKYQTSPYTVMSLTSTPISEASDLKGKTIAVDDNNITLLNNLLLANDLTPADITTVPANYDISLLSSGQVDGYVAYIPDEPISVQLMGNDVTRLDVEDFGLPSVGGLYFVTDEMISNERDAVAAGLRTFIRGIQAYLTDPDEAVELTNEAMGADAPSDPEYNPLSYEAYKELMIGGEVAETGLMMLTEEHQQSVIDTLALSGVDIEASQMFDLSILEEVLADDPALKEVPGVS